MMKIIDMRMRPPFGPYLDKGGMFDMEADYPFAAKNFPERFGMCTAQSVKEASMEQLFAEMDRAGEMTGVVSIRKNARGYENDALVDLLKKYPTRFVGACGIAPAISINGKVYPKVAVNQVASIIEEYRQLGGAE